MYGFRCTRGGARALSVFVRPPSVLVVLTVLTVLVLVVLVLLTASGDS